MSESATVPPNSDFNWQWYILTTDDGLVDGFNNEQFLSGRNPEPLDEFGLLDEQRNRVIRFVPDNDIIILNGYEFSLNHPGENCRFEIKRHQKFNDTNRVEVPRVFKIGYPSFLVVFDSSDGSFGFEIREASDESPGKPNSSVGECGG